MNFDKREAQRAVMFFEGLKHTKSPFYGKPFKLLEWELQVVRDVYGTLNDRGLRQYKYVYIEIPKKNGKSELAAAFGLKQLFFDNEINGEVYGCAGDKEQASLVFDVVFDMIGQVPALKKRCKPNISQKFLTDRLTGTTYKVVSSEAYTKHGLNLSACVFDELHVQPNRDLWDVMTKGAGDARLQPLWVIITTAGDDPDRTSIGWEVHNKAKAILEARDSGDAAKDIPTWYPVIYSYDGEDIYNEENWKIANPSLGATFTIERMREAAREAQQNPADERAFRWLRLNQWPKIKLTSWLPVTLFDDTVVPRSGAFAWNRAAMMERKAYIGLDLSSTIDLTGTCTIFPPDINYLDESEKDTVYEYQEGIQYDWRVIWDAWIPAANMQQRIREDKIPYNEWAAAGYIHPTEGDAIDYPEIERRIIEQNEMYDVRELASDPSFATMLLQRLEQNNGMVIVQIPQYYKYLTDPMQMIETLLRKRIKIDMGNDKIIEVPALTHEANPVARWCFGNTSVHKNGSGQMKYVKETKGKTVQRTKRIDLTAAWVICMARAKYYESAIISSSPLEAL